MEAVGVVLAGGAGRRIGGDKALVELHGVPLLHHPLRALRAVCDEVAVAAKRDTRLPALGGAAVWIEPDEPRHPLTGILHALRLAGGRPVLVVAVDLVCLDAATLRTILDADDRAAQAVVPVAGGRRQPLCALYRPSARVVLEHVPDGTPLTAALEVLRVCEVPFADARPFHNVNAPEDLLCVPLSPRWRTSGGRAG